MLKWLLKSIRWDICGKRIRLIVSERVDAAAIGDNLRGTVTRVLTKEFDSGGSGRARLSAVISLDAPVSYMGRTFDTVLAVPRHKGLDIDALLLTSIAVYVIPIANAAGADDARWDDIVAIWSLARG